MTRTRSTLGLAATTALVLAGLSRAQAPTLRVEAVLAADAARKGPAAWTFVREFVLPQVVGDPSGVPPVAEAIRVRLDDQGNLEVQPDVLREDLDGAYARFRLFVGSEAKAEGSCAFDGTERWNLDEPLADLPALLDRLVALVGPSVRNGWLEVDVSTAVGNLMTAATTADALSEAMTLGAFECGTLGLFARTAHGGTLRVVGKSDGGLTLPAVLTALAIAQGGPGPGGPGTGDRDELERHLLLAASAHAAERDEALRQLSRFDDASARDALTRNLLDDGPARTIAVHGLARDRRALDPLLRAAEAGDPLAPAVAADLLPTEVRYAGGKPAPCAAPLGETVPHGVTGTPGPNSTFGLVLVLVTGLVVGTALGFALRPRVE